MSRRTQAGVLAVVLLVLLFLVAARNPVPYVTVSPGPTVDILGESDGKPIVRVEGRRTYSTDGELRLTTVSISTPDREIDLLTALGAWLRTDIDVLPREVMYPDDRSTEEERAESAAQMVNSQDAAVAAALRELGVKLPSFPEVTGITPDGPSEGELKPRDRLLTLNGTSLDDVDTVLEILGEVDPGAEVRGEVRRGERTVPFEITTRSSPDDPERAILGIMVGTGFDFPFEVSVRINEGIGGPSAGLMFALSIYDTLTPGALTGGRVIAGTGSISSDGAVGAIGGIREKIIAAERAGAELFFVPPDNCDSALAAPVEDDEILLVKAETLSSAVQALETYTDDPTADLPRCS